MICRVQYGCRTAQWSICTQTCWKSHFFWWPFSAIDMQSVILTFNFNWIRRGIGNIFLTVDTTIIKGSFWFWNISCKSFQANFGFVVIKKRILETTKSLLLTIFSYGPHGTIFEYDLRSVSVTLNVYCEQVTYIIVANKSVRWEEYNWGSLSSKTIRLTPFQVTYKKRS